MNQQQRTRVCAMVLVPFAPLYSVVLAGSTDQRSTSTDQVQLPQTPAGRCASAYLDAFNSGDDRQMRDFTLQHRKGSYLQKHPIERIIERYRTIHKKTR